MNKKKKIVIGVLFGLLLNILSGYAQQRELDDFTETEKPWLWWYWLGSSVTHEGIDWHLSQFKEMGYGGVSIAATYGVKGYESRQIPFMSPQWVDMLNYTANQFKKSDMGVDISLTSAWPFGGPNVNTSMAAQYSTVKHLLTAAPGEKIAVAVGNLQKGKVCAISAYAEDNEYLDLTSKMGIDGILRFTFSNKKWEIYALFSLPTNQTTKRSGIGGEGLVLDHFNRASVTKYLKRYDSLFLSKSNLRGTFNDSYEVYGADYSSVFLDEFEKRRGYDLRKYLYLLDPTEKSDSARMALCDYRETISDMLLDNFVNVWGTWAKKHGVKTVEQAHGTPANWLDLYGAADIPQTESFGASPLHIKNVRIDPVYNEKIFGRPDKMLLKFASSASHVMGKQFTSAESATWLGDHFKVALSQVKPQIDELFVSGINHVMLTCGAYSPKEIQFPGWRFYPASNFGYTSAFKSVIPKFSLYVSRSQHLLQNSKPDNDVLLYLPMYDFWTECNDEDGRSKLTMFTIHNPDNWFYRQDIGDIARTLKREGFDFDYVSDRQIAHSNVAGGDIVTQGGTHYKIILVPSCKRMPLVTLMNLKKYADLGVKVVFAYRMPYDVPGMSNLKENRTKFFALLKELKNHPNVVINANYVEAVNKFGIPQEEFGKKQLEFIRKKNNKGVFYFVANQSNEFTEGWIKLGIPVDEVTLFDPLTGKEGVANLVDGKLFLQLKPSQSCFIKLYNEGVSTAWSYFTPITTYRIDGKWNVSFKEGNPTLPASFLQARVGSWTDAPDTMAIYFSGVGVYETLFDLPTTPSKQYMLSLGDVRETAKVWINGMYVGNVWSVPFDLKIDATVLKKKNNTLRIEVRNLDANRMIWLDRHKVPWQTFFLVDVAYRNFNASAWESVPSGLLGPIEIQCGK